MNTHAFVVFTDTTTDGLYNTVVLNGAKGHVPGIGKGGVKAHGQSPFGIHGHH